MREQDASRKSLLFPVFSLCEQLLFRLPLLYYVSTRYDNIFTSNGVSLHELSMKISKDMELSERETDDLCRECGQGGDIFPCKMCPRSFHPGRVSHIPELIANNV